MPNTSTLLTEEEKVRVRHHTGYLNSGSAQTFALGIPAQVQTQFLIEGAMDKILPAALGHFRNLLARCDCTEAQMFENQENLALVQLGNMQLNQDEQKKLRDVYLYWRSALCNMLGIPPNPYDMRFSPNGGTGVNVPVSHGI